ncbi:MAG: Hsp70 family protein [Polyangiales bacterium]
MAGAVVGIDLGTTNTVVAVVRGGKAIVLADDDGHRLLPSVVSFHPSGEVLVGSKARERRLVDARNTVYSIKRLIGRSWQSDEVERARQRFPFELREGPTHGPLVVARGETYTLPEISAFVLRKAKAIAEKALGEPVERAVVTVPASFNDLQRASTKVAAREAGLEVLRILNEPTAAALAYGFGKQGNERVAVYDFGGGTFDLTLLDLSGNVFEVIATAGDSFLGGDDVDQVIADRISMDIVQRTRFDPRGDVQIMERLRAAAEQIKIALSTQNEMSIELKEIGYGPGGSPIDVKFSLTRQQLEAISEPLVDRTFRVCEEALQLARLKNDAFDNIILVGGSTRIPLVRRRVEGFFVKKPMDHVNPDEVVAIGAAIQAAALTGAERRRQQTPAPVLEPDAVKASRIQTLGGVGKKESSQTGRGPLAPPPKTTGRLIGPNLGQETPRPLSGALPGHAPPLAPESAPPPPAGHHPGTQAYPNIPGALPAPQRVVPSTTPLVPQSRPLDRGTGRIVTPPIGDVFGARRELPSITDSTDEVTTLPRGFPDHSPEPMQLTNLAPPVEQPLPPPVPAGPPMRLRTQVGMAPFPGALTAPNAAPPPLPQSVPPLPPHSISHPIPQASPDLSPLPGPQPMAAPMGAFAQQQKAPSWAPQNELGANVPLLIDVTPLSLAVETVGGFVDKVIERNTPVPCAQTRNFTTSSDNQQIVIIRVCQGEGEAFAQNNALGTLELSGLRGARRGEVTIEVTFELDADGILQVSARDLETQRSTSARMKLIGLEAQGSGKRMMPAVV